MNVKKKHHFVSQFYLRNWEGLNGQICVGSDGKKPFFGTSKNVGHSNSFYKIESLSLLQISFLSQQMKSMKYENLSTYKLLVNSLVEMGIKLDLLSMEQEKKIFESNIIEESFSYAEETFSPVLSKIITERSNCSLTLYDYEVLIHFIAFQLTKTPKKLEAAKGKDCETKRKLIARYKFTENQYHTFTLYLAMCTSEKLYLACLSRLNKINIYFNNSETNFITSDDPSFNQKFNENKLHIQIPISPKILLEVTENTDCNVQELTDYFNYNFNRDNDSKKIIKTSGLLINFFDITEEEVITVNRKISDNKHKFIYASKESDFSGLIK